MWQGAPRARSPTQGLAERLPLERDLGGGAEPTCGVQLGESTDYSTWGTLAFRSLPKPPFQSIGSLAPPPGWGGWILGLYFPPDVIISATLVGHSGAGAPGGSASQLPEGGQQRWARQSWFRRFWG